MRVEFLAQLIAQLILHKQAWRVEDLDRLVMLDRGGRRLSIDERQVAIHLQIARVLASHHSYVRKLYFACAL